MFPLTKSEKHRNKEREKGKGGTTRTKLRTEITLHRSKGEKISKLVSK